ncbi:MAG: hypothetical protein WDZ37_02550 [Solirubrobacterales bacterium]
MSGSPLAAIRQRDGKGLLVVRKGGRPPRDLSTFAGDLTSELSRRFADFQKQTSRVLSIRAGVALVYSYLRTRRRTTHTVVIVPAADRTFDISTVSPADDKQSATQIAAMVRQFDTGSGRRSAGGKDRP